MARERKYQYLKVIQGCVENQWYDYTAYDKNDRGEMKLFRDDLKVYRENEPYPIRVITRRIPANAQYKPNYTLKDYEA